MIPANHRIAEDTPEVSEQFERYRRLLFSIAYRMLGSAMEAEDIVQEAYLRYRDTPPENIQSPKAFLSTVVTRLCLDQLKSAQVQRETYIGPWLPEPVLTGEGAMLPSHDYDSISMAFLVLLESLTPVERAVFLLREVFDYDYAEIARMVGKEEAACRQLLSRARKHVAEHRPRFHSTPQEHQEMIGKFLLAVQAGDLDGLMNLLADDITWWSDGGGKVTAARRPLHGREQVARFVLGLRRLAPQGIRVEIAEINGRPAIVMRYADGTPSFVIVFAVANGKIHRAWAIGNPDKLKHL
jgi:RNA polymerase sigma-70 factor (ECF subfamily)